MKDCLGGEENLYSYDDRGWYENPPGTQADVASKEDLSRDNFNMIENAEVTP